MSEVMVLEFEKDGQKEKLLTADEKMKKVIELALHTAITDLSILLTGETGVGKDVLAKVIHNHSYRKDKSFVVVDCPTIPESLFESELFGHKKGTYTGASIDYSGLIEKADRGTLYLNEIGEINQNVQIKLLGLVDNKEFRRLGETKLRKIDTRIIAATNGNLEEMVKKGTFRKDLYYRLKVCHFHLLALRERPKDVPILVEYFLSRYSPYKLLLDPKIMEILFNYEWPGNVRELENLVKSLITFAKNLSTETAYISLEEFQQWELEKPLIAIPYESMSEKVMKLEKELIQKALIQANGVKKEAARILEIPESTLRWKMRKYGITYP